MRKSFLLTAVLLLSCAWAVAQTSPSSPSQSTQPSTQSPSTTSPSSTSPSAQQPDTSSSGSAGATSGATSSDKGNAIEGCLAGSAGSYTLTDASGTSYQLAGDTSKLADHVGHQVKVWGDAGSASSASTGASASASAGQTFNVKRVKMVASSCSNK